MKRTLILVRHAKSFHDNYIKRDHERHLAPRGYEDAAASANWCKMEGFTTDLIVSSTAIRAYSTAIIFANEFGFPTDKILLKSAIYNASVQDLIYTLNELDVRYKTVMMFGHNPGFTELINALCGSVISHLPTSGVAAIEFENAEWSSINLGSGRLIKVYSSHKDFE